MMIRSLKNTTAALLVALPLTVLSVSPVLAQSKMAPMPPKQASSKMAPVYVCKACKAYLTAPDAKKMAYKDPMGHKLVKMSKAPAGYMDGAKMHKMDNKMGGMNKKPGNR